MRSFKFLACAAAAAAMLVACGGGGGAGDQTTKISITSVKVYGDSLTDSGTFKGIPGYGRVFSVQDDSQTQLVWSELVAGAYGVSSLCNFYKFTGTTFTTNTVAGCTSYGIGGSRINNALKAGGNASPQAIRAQMATGLTVAGGSYKSTDLLLIDGGGNDAADLIGAYVAAASDGGASLAALFTSASVTLDPTKIPESGVNYMTTLATTHYNTIKTQALDKGATHVVVLNIPAVQKTPRLQEVLDLIALSKGGGTAGATARANAEALFRTWIIAFNTQLATLGANNPNLIVVDFFSNNEDQIANPAQYAFTNVTTPACPSTGVGTDGLKTYNFQTCTAAALSASPPTGVTDPNWWKTYAFSDSFHPTPAAYQRIAQLVTKALLEKGWL